DQSADIHRMTYDCVRSGRYDFLLGADFDGSGGKGVFLEHEKHEVESERDQDVAERAHIQGHRGPRKTMVERGDNKHRDECRRGERLYDVLAPLLLGTRPRIGATLQKLRIVFNQV